MISAHSLRGPSHHLCQQEAEPPVILPQAPCCWGLCWVRRCFVSEAQWLKYTAFPGIVTAMYFSAPWISFQSFRSFCSLIRKNHLMVWLESAFIDSQASLFSPSGLHFSEESLTLWIKSFLICNISQANWETGDFCLLILLSSAFLPVKVIFPFPQKVNLLLLVILNKH